MTDFDGGGIGASDARAFLSEAGKYDWDKVVNGETASEMDVDGSGRVELNDIIAMKSVCCAEKHFI